LNKDLYEVARKDKKEMPFAEQYSEFDGIGTYYCAHCGSALFKSDAKSS
jgi:peptide-methionine (R)-S-oxide reductase